MQILKKLDHLQTEEQLSDGEQRCRLAQVGKEASDTQEVDAVTCATQEVDAVSCATWRLWCATRQSYAEFTRFLSMG